MLQQVDVLHGEKVRVSNGTLLWHDQQMHTRRRVRILERHDRVILVDDIRRLFLTHDTREYILRSGFLERWKNKYTHWNKIGRLRNLGLSHAMFCRRKRLYAINFSCNTDQWQLYESAGGATSTYLY